jgi:CRISPR/Cas system-associated exonuclease Cas4 (RecB family)
MHGHSDLVSETHIGEIKSAGEWSFNKYAVTPKKEHIAQASIYGNFLGREHINLLYFNKNSGELAEVEVKVDHSKVEELTDFAEAVLAFYSIEKLPPKIENEKKCKDCPYQHICE